mgnify:CR=1 FL=1
MMNTYIFEYLDENDFRKKERSVRKYNMLAYKKLTFNYYPELRKGNFSEHFEIQGTGFVYDNYYDLFMISVERTCAKCLYEEEDIDIHKFVTEIYKLEEDNLKFFTFL